MAVARTLEPQLAAATGEQLPSSVMPVQVIVPTRDRVEYLPDCVASILAQTWTALEVVVVDNASRVGVAAALRGLRDPRLSYVRRDITEGSVGNIRAAMSLATAPYFIVFHDDDSMHPRLIEAQMRTFREQPALTFVGGGYRAERDPRAISRFEALATDGASIFDGPRALVGHFISGGSLHFGSVMYRRSAVPQPTLDSDRFGKLADRPFLISLADAGPCAVLNGPWVNWRIHPKQDSRIGELREDHVLELFRSYRAVLAPTWDAKTRWRFLTFATNSLLDVHPLIPSQNKRHLLVSAWRAYREGLLHPFAVRRAGVVVLLRWALGSALPIARHPALGSARGLTH